MKRIFFIIFIILVPILFMANTCSVDSNNTSAIEEQKHIEQNQQNLNEAQPSPTITWSLERDNLIKRFKLMNDRSVMFYMYLFIEGVADPIGYYQVNKVSSVNSQLTATQQIISGRNHSNDLPADQIAVIESPAEDGSYGTNGDGVFGFTPEDIYIEHNMKYVVSTVPLTFRNAVQRLAILTPDQYANLKELMKRVNK